MVDRVAVGPFTTSVTYVRPDGERVEWHSRAQRKHASRVSRARHGHEHPLWSPHRGSWWIAVLFSLGSVCFLVAPFPGFVSLVGAEADGYRLLRRVDAVHRRRGDPVARGHQRRPRTDRCRRGAVPAARLGAWPGGLVEQRDPAHRHVLLRLHDLPGAHRPGGLIDVRHARLATGRARLRLLPGVVLPRVRRGRRPRPSSAHHRGVGRHLEPARLRGVRGVRDGRLRAHQRRHRDQRDRRQRRDRPGSPRLPDRLAAAGAGGQPTARAGPGSRCATSSLVRLPRPPPSSARGDAPARPVARFWSR